MPSNPPRFGQGAARRRQPSGNFQADTGWTIHPLAVLEAGSIRGIKSCLQLPAWGKEATHWLRLAKNPSAARA